MPDKKLINSENIYPTLPLRDVVVYPNMLTPLFVGRPRSVRALEQAMAGNKKILLVAQKNPAVDNPVEQDVYSIGTLSNILQLLKLPDGTIKVLVEGSARTRIRKFIEVEKNFLVAAEVLKQTRDDSDEANALVLAVANQFEHYIKLNKKIPSETLKALSEIDDAGLMADTVSAHMSIRMKQKQKVLEILCPKERIIYILSLIEAEIDMLKVEKKIRGQVKTQMEKSQREYYLNEQMKAIQKELGDVDDVPNEIEDLANKIYTLGMTKEAKDKALAELKKLKMMSPMSAEATVVRNYLDWLVNVPWKKRSKISRNLDKAAKILDEDHYGLEKVKERILEYLSVQSRVRKIKGPILCLVGSPGVGKTSLGRSIARATNREFIRMSLGGVRDEAEIRGHRRTYIGSMPGKVIQNIARVGKKNPLFLFDEIDKMAMDFRGDPASALLEVLDPEQNHAFSDHYLEVDYDVSEVMFVTTANSLDIPAPLLDRMEIIHISGYTESEKINIANRYLVPKQIKENGLKNSEISITENTIRDIIRYYTHESGVRGLERQIANICRKVLRQILQKPTKKCFTVTANRLEKLIGVRRFRYGRAEAENRIGQVTGLAWTSAGGDLLTIEVAILNGKGKTIRTGRLGDVMQESIEAAMTVVRSRSDMLGVPIDFYKQHDFHIHVPEGATPKDGPSAGVAMCVALISALTAIPVRSSVAMTGEITLRGEILPIGGLKEKLLAALRGGIKTVLIPKENEKDLTEIPKDIKQGLDIQAVRWVDEVIKVALQDLPESLMPNTDDKATDLKKSLKTGINDRNSATRPH